MATVSLEVYLFFNGNAQEAMEFYKGIFGGELTMQKYSQIPGNTELDMADKLIHADLKGGVIGLMASDYSGEKKGSGNIELSLVGTDDEKLRQVFDALSAGGEVRQPLEKQYWGDVFGSLTDKYGVSWMFNIGKADSENT
jgi:PhnB protein